MKLDIDTACLTGAQRYCSKMGIDATRKWAAERFARPWPEMIRMAAATKATVDAIWEKLEL